MSIRKLAALIAGVILALLGGLWLVQGLGLVHIKPIACVANCEPLEGASTTWAVVGAIVLMIGVLAIVYGLRRRPVASGRDKV
jgi:hypothetical protein